MTNLLTLTVNLTLLVTIPYHWLSSNALAQSKIYQPINIKENQTITDKLTANDKSYIFTDGTTIAENDDSPDSTSNSLLFTRIATAGKYIVRVRAFGQTGSGNFKLKVTKLKPAQS